MSIAHEIVSVRSAVPTIGSGTAKESTPAEFPLGERGMSPSFVCTDDGALDLDDRTAAYALTANESY